MTSPDYNKVIIKLLDAVENLCKLEIITEVGQPIATAAATSGGEVSPPLTIRTTISLIEADIKSAIPADFFSAENEPLRTFHQSQVELARQIMSNNIKGITSAIQELRGRGGGEAG